jgi:hypothetical protein
MQHPPPGWPPPWHVPPPGGWELARAIFHLEAESRRHTEILLSLQERVLRLPTEIIDRMPPHPPPPPAPPPPASQPEPPTPGIAQRLGTLREWLLAATALAALAAAVAGKLTAVELVDVLRKLAGVP